MELFEEFKRYRTFEETQPLDAFLESRTKDDWVRFIDAAEYMLWTKIKSSEPDPFLNTLRFLYAQGLSGSAGFFELFQLAMNDPLEEVIISRFKKSRYYDSRLYNPPL